MCVGMLFWSLQHGAMYGIIDTSQLQILFADCNVHCGVEHLNTVSAATGAELLTVLTEWAGALLWVELSVGGLLMVSAGLVLSIQLNTTFGNGLWMALIKDMMKCAFPTHRSGLSRTLYDHHRLRKPSIPAKPLFHPFALSDIHGVSPVVFELYSFCELYSLR